jgi:hypothetical protein
MAMCHNTATTRVEGITAMNVRRVSHVIGRAEISYRRGERAAILGVGVVQIRAYVDRPCLLVRYPDGQEHAVLFEDISAGIYALESSEERTP